MVCNVVSNTTVPVVHFIFPYTAFEFGRVPEINRVKKLPTSTFL